jgi:L-ascorbate metabolism protein UlaG (beta-lactamase superfamily)
MEIGGIKLDYLGHSGFVITNSDGKRIAIDPYSVSDSAGKADIILITHGHYDHCSIKDIEKMKKEGVESPDRSDAVAMAVWGHTFGDAPRGNKLNLKLDKMYSGSAGW